MRESSLLCGCISSRMKWLCGGCDGSILLIKTKTFNQDEESSLRGKIVIIVTISNVRRTSSGLN